jgi:hypothetical protein
MSLAVNIAQIGSNNTTFRNRIINGAMVISQRFGTTSNTPANGDYVLDRFIQIQTVAGKYSVQQNAGSVSVLGATGFTNYLGCTSLSAYSIAAGDVFAVSQRIEGYNLADLAYGTANAKTVTVSAWVYSSLTGTFGGSLLGFSGGISYPFTYSIPVANTWTQISVTIPGNTTTALYSTTNGIGLQLNFGLGVGSTYSGTAGAWNSSGSYSATGATSVVGTSGATFYITGVQLEAGSTASPFEYRSYGTELALCQRYCMAWRIDGAAQQYIAVGQAYAAANAIYMIPLPVTPRVTPTGIVTSAAGGFGSLTSNGAGSTGSSITIVAASNMALTIIYVATVSSFASGNATALYFNGTTGAYIYTSGSEL